MKCWSCGGPNMRLKEDRSWYVCDCGATETVGGASDTETRPEGQKASAWATKNA